MRSTSLAKWRQCAEAKKLIAILADTERASSGPFVEGFLSNLLNPKCALFYLAFLPLFVAPSDPPLPKLLLLAGTHLAMSITWLLALTWVAGMVRAAFAQRKLRRCMEWTSGTVLIALGVRLAVAER